ncbi:MAG: TetR/AcrR family transcriptional regulator [Marinosulfonomonas sp.]|nr:TetR/AcrR family transcriptional regulator [Marinosulfonomonas sp.]
MSSPQPDTRNRILKAALELLEGNPHKETRMSDIAKRAGISRQAVYLHFTNRADLLIAATVYLDEITEVDAQLAQSRSAKTGPERLDAFIEAWGAHIPRIYGVAQALLAMKDTDEAAGLAWNNRMQAVRHGCAAAVAALERDHLLAADHSAKQATDILWTLLSVRNWEQLTGDCDWSQTDYIEQIKALARRVLLTAPPNG